jgi:SAM-dependent methyltransferase
VTTTTFPDKIARLCEFKFPRPPGSTGDFVWDGQNFVNEFGTQSRVLSYSKAESGWDTNLTLIHEQESGTRHPIDRASRKLAIRSIEEFCRFSDSIVLEVGCSSGFFLEQLTSEIPRAAVIGSDYIEQPLGRLARRLHGVPLLQFDLRECPLPEASVDVIVCLNVLEHIDNDVQAISQLFRILKPGGILHVEVPAGPKLYDLYDEFLMHHRRYQMGGLKEKAIKAGFEIYKATHLGFLAYFPFVVRKLWNRTYSSYSKSARAIIAASQMRHTSESKALEFLLALEALLGLWVRFPFGVRCVLTLRKPLKNGPPHC